MNAPALIVLLLGLAADAPKPIEVKAPARPGPASYAKEISEILDAKCAGCHGSALAEKGLNLESVAGMLKGGKRGPALVPGKADASLVFTMAAHRVEPVMPPAKKKDLPPLTPEELGLLKLWIDAGAKDDSDASPAPTKPVEIGTLPPGVHPINALDMTPDGLRVASGRANVVEVFDVDSGLLITRLGGHRDLIQSVRYTPDAKRLAAGSFGIVTLWDCPVGSLQRTFAGPTEPIGAMVATRDGKTLVTGGVGKGLRFWNVADGKTFKTVDLAAGAEALAFSPDESLLAAAGSDHVVRVLKVADGKQDHAFTGHTAAVTSIAFLDDGKTVAAAGLDGTVRAWTLPDKAGEAVISKTIDVKPVMAMGPLPDRKTLVAACNDGKVHLVAWPDGREVRSFPLEGGLPWSLALSPDGKTALVGSADGAGRLYDLDSGRLGPSFRLDPGLIRAVGFSPKGDRVFVGNESGILKVWDLAGSRELMTFGPSSTVNSPMEWGGFHRAFFLDDGRIASAIGKSARVWTFEGSWSDARTFGPHAFRVLAIDFSPDGKLMATGGGEPSRSGEVKVWDVATGKLVRSLDTLHSDTVFALRFSPDGTKLASASADKFVKVINVADGKELKSFEGHTHHVLGVDWTGDGKRLVSAGADGAVKVWDFETGEQGRTMNGGGKAVTGLRSVPGKQLLVGCSGDGTVRAWNPNSGATPRTFSGASDYLFAVAASADGGRVAAGGADGVLLLWDGEGKMIRKVPDAK